ncbi:MAG TPA: LysM peptidoglycan-binding domain-containing protein [Pseudonocardiaceae bacterium]
MTAAAGLRNRPAVGDPEVGPVVGRSGSSGRSGLGTRSVRQAAPTRPHSACPAWASVTTPAPRVLHLARTAGARVPAARRAEAVRPATWLGRLAGLVAATAVTLTVVGGLGWMGQAAGPGVPAETAVVRVGAGETVWDVAQRVAPQSDQRAVVERIRQLNRMVNSAIEPGQLLQVPGGR